MKLLWKILAVKSMSPWFLSLELIQFSWAHTEQQTINCSCYWHPEHLPSLTAWRGSIWTATIRIWEFSWTPCLLQLAAQLAGAVGWEAEIKHLGKWMVAYSNQQKLGLDLAKLTWIHVLSKSLSHQCVAVKTSLWLLPRFMISWHVGMLGK